MKEDGKNGKVNFSIFSVFIFLLRISLFLFFFFPGRCRWKLLANVSGGRNTFFLFLKNIILKLGKEKCLSDKFNRGVTSGVFIESKICEQLNTWVVILEELITPFHRKILCLSLIQRRGIHLWYSAELQSPLCHGVHVKNPGTVFCSGSSYNYINISRFGLVQKWGSDVENKVVSPMLPSYIDIVL